MWLRGFRVLNDFMKQLSSYNLFNCLLPGVIFVVAVERFTTIVMTPSNLLVAAFVYYFVGMIISRVGSLVLEPALKQVRFVRFAAYSKFVAASKTDSKLEVLSETNNSYRTMLSCALLIGLVVLWERVIIVAVPGVAAWGAPLLATGTIALFLFAYRKQSSYIRQRVEANAADK